MRKNLKNYTSKQKIETTIQDLEKLIVKAGATQFFKEFENGEVTSVVFIIPTEHGKFPVKMPARWEKVLHKIYGDHSSYWQRDIDQAKRTAWKNVYDWIDAQLALIETEQVKLEEIFLPYFVDAQGKTLFERAEKLGFNFPQLDSGAKTGEVIE